MNAMINAAMQLFYDELDRRELAGIQARKVLDAQQAAADARDEAASVARPVQALDVAVLDDISGNKPATDAQTIAELLKALELCADALENIDGLGWCGTIAAENACRVASKTRAAIERAEGRAA
jgi:hypothetical protein